MKYPKPPVPLEKDIQRSIMDWMDLVKIYHWRQPQAKVRAILRHGRLVHIPIPGGKRGVSDILGFFNGKFFALEIKRPGEKPTKEQMEFLVEVSKHGQLAGWADSLKEAQLFFKDVVHPPLKV